VIYIDVQHIGKPNRTRDMGASIGDAPEQTEAYWTSLYAFYMEMHLRSLGYAVFRLSDGTYRSRHERVNLYEDTIAGDGPSVYIACHINAGGGRGSYGAMFYDYRSTNGSNLADAISETMQALPHLATVKKIPADPSDWTRNAYHTIKGVNRPVSICAEPFFIDNELHQEYMTLDMIKLIGREMANGIHLWYTRQ
jgi:N-acetylmuramoyl-L-alanine amidase